MDNVLKRFEAQLRDEEIIYDVYRAYFTCNTNKRLPALNQSKIISLRAQLLLQVEKCVLLLSSMKSTEVEKEKIVNKGKKYYQEYCNQMKSNPDIKTDRLVQKTDELLHLMAAYEAKQVSILRNRYVSLESVDLKVFFNKNKKICELIKNPINKIIPTFDKIDLSIGENESSLSEENKDIVYITGKGSKYHKKECLFCKGKIMQPVIKKEAEEKKLSPCKCIEIEENVKKEVTYKEKDIQELKSNNLIPIKVCESDVDCVTVFVDESVRKNPWKKVDDSLPETQGVYSYIICEGEFFHENQITIDNTICSNVGMIPESRKTNDVAIEAISEVLLKLISYGFRGKVLVYTDNLAASNTWHRNEKIRNLTRYFSAVTVCHVPREENTKADALGRERIFMDLSASFVNKILAKCKAYDKLKETLFQAEIDYGRIGK